MFLVLLAIVTVLLLQTWLLLRLHRRVSGAGTADQLLRDELRQGRAESAAAARQLREEVSLCLHRATDSVVNTMSEFGNLQTERLGTFSTELAGFARSSKEEAAGLRAALECQLRQLKESGEHGWDEMRKEVSGSLKQATDSVVRTMGEFGRHQSERLTGFSNELGQLTLANSVGLEALRVSVDGQLRQIQEGNERKLEEMRRTVDEKLQGALEKRLGESFKLVSERLEAVHKGLGEMQGLAAGVGDLKRVLTNVKTRGTWAELQLGAILEQLLTPDQFGRNVQVKPSSREHVEYAVRLPGIGDSVDDGVWLPIDSKFPQEDYIRLQDAAERADPDAVREASAGLARSVKGFAKDISEKYLDPPNTTDFAIMFLPTEGLYAEVLRQPGLVENIQVTHRVMITGPTTFAGLLCSLRMGFRSVAIAKRAGEVWRVLGAVKMEFSRFGQVLGKVKEQLDTASRTIEKTEVRSRALQRRLRDVEELPAGDAAAILALSHGETGANLEATPPGAQVKALRE